MTQAIGKIQRIYQHPIKSMAGRLLNRAELDWHGLVGDRRFAFRRLDADNGFPWLSAGRMPGLLLYRPQGGSATGAPTQVETPTGASLDLWSDELSTELSERLGSKVELMHLKHGMFDDAAISIITSGTLKALDEEAGQGLDVRRFRPNIVIETNEGKALEEDSWVGKIVCFGDAQGGPAISITMLDKRCSMIGLDPDTAASNPDILKAAVRLNDFNAGVYGTVTNIGSFAVGDPVFIR
jgi:uncharacterized protein YcbX